MSDRSRHRRGPRASAVAHRRRRPWTAWLAAAALLFHALLPLLHTPPRLAGNADVPAWVFGSFCRSPTAIAPISADDKPLQTPAKPAPFCPICQSAQTAGTFLPPHRDDLPLPDDAGRIVPPETPAILTGSLANRLYPARAPPLPA